MGGCILYAVGAVVLCFVFVFWGRAEIACISFHGVGEGHSGWSFVFFFLGLASSRVGNRMIDLLV